MNKCVSVLGSQNFHCGKGTYKYGKAGSEKLPCGDGLELEISLHTHEIFICTSLGMHA